MGAHDFKLNKVPFFALKSANINVSRPETSSCANKQLLLQCKLVKPQCLCQVSLGLKEVQMGPMTSNFTMCLFFLLENLLYVSCYMCDIKQSHLKVCAKFH